MTNNPAIVRSLLVYVICLPLAIFLGFLLSDPLDRDNAIWFAIGILLLALPLLLRWYHVWMIAIWNMTITFIYMPGMLPGWMPMACIAFAVAVGHYVLNRQRKFLPSGSVSWSLIFLSLVVFVTAKMRGGLGFNALGDEAVGGKRYLFIWVAVVGYFALISQPIPPRKRKLYTCLFLLGTVTAALNNLSTLIGPLGNVLYIFFPGVNMMTQDPMAETNMERFGGFAAASVAIVLTLLALYSIQEILNPRKIWRLILFLAAIVLSALGGYRSMFIMVVLIVGIVFYLEGLFRSRLLPVAVLGGIVTAGLIFCFSDSLPLSIQRCLAFLPVKISPIARMSAEASSDWRIEMWKSLLPEIPRYLFLGKGLTFDSNDMAMYATLGQDQVGGEAGGGMNLAGDYHNGPLSTIIPFGIWGMIGFLWFLVASIKVLWKNYKYGDPDLYKINILLLGYFLAKTILFLFVFGGFYGDLVIFVGIVGMSIALNGGVATKPVLVADRPQIVFNRFRRLPVGKPMPST